MPRILIGIGLACILMGLLAWLLERAGVRLGALPGDIAFGAPNARVYFPVATCILLSVFLSSLMWLARALRK
jgi:ABC-type enterobactin transport system permease subunit